MIDSYLLNVEIDGTPGQIIWIDNADNFGFIVKAIREYLHVSQTKFARMLGTNQATISQWEQGVVTPTLPTILRLSAFVETPILIGGVKIS